MASTIVESKICNPFNAPTITAPASQSQTTSSSIHVAGAATSGMTITVTNNGTGAGATIAASGSYGLEIPLSIGTNDLVATTVNDCDTVKNSSIVTVTRTILHGAPMAPTSPSGSTSTGTSGSASSTLPISSITPAPATNSITTTPVVPVPAVPTVPVAAVTAPVVSSTPTIAQEIANIAAIISNPPATIAESAILSIPLSLTKPQEQVITKPKPNQTLTNERTWISGTAAPLTNISVYINKVLTARVTSDDQGTYSVMVELADGDNQIHVFAKSSDGKTTLRQINVKLDKSVRQTEPTAKLADGPLVGVIIASFALGGMSISGSIWWHARHLRKTRGVTHV
jgi:Glucodextranase, domain B